MKSVEADRIAYDLHCTKGSECRHVEVKGRALSGEVIHLTVNEWNKAINDQQFHIAIVSGLGNDSVSMKQWTGVEFQREYDVKPIMYRAAQHLKRRS